MKSIHQYLILTLLIIATQFGVAQESQVFDNLTVQSDILSQKVKYSIYLPAGYESNHRHYPVVYLLHGGGPHPERHQQWIVQGDMQRIMDEGIKNGSMSSTIIVMADAERSYYMNNTNGKYQYEDFYIQELIPHIEKTYRCRTEKKFRGIIGLSMGGFGALLYAFKHPDLFNACAAFSSAIRTDEEIRAIPHSQYLARHGTAMGQLQAGEERITDFWRQNHPLHLVQSLPVEQLKKVKYYVDCGDDDDYLYKGNSLLHITMRERGIPHEFRIRDGAHNWLYWQQGLKDGMAFLTKHFR